MPTPPTPHRFGINGFGRIGRTAFRVWWQYHRDRIQLALINTSGSMEIEDWLHLLRFDSNYGFFTPAIEVQPFQTCKEVSDDNPLLGKLIIEGREILVTAQRDPSKLPWGQYDIETVIESTGAFVTAEKASQHLRAGAKTVILSAPAKGEGVSTAVIGVNDFDSDNPIRSNASCTTNCVAPVVRVISEQLGVKKATLTTIHAYTDDQNLQDNSHKDLRRARTAGQNIIPTSTGAASATAEIIPALKGHFDGLAVRVPVAVGSLSDIVMVVERPTSVAEINQILSAAAQTDRWRGILAVTNYPIVSSDVIGRRESSLVDLQLTQVIAGDLVKVVSWYDNEFGYCNRLIEQVGRA